MDRDAILRRGHGAEKLLSDESVMQALGEIEAELITNWAESNPAHVDHRESIFRQVKALELFQNKLESWRSAATMEKAKMEIENQDRRGMQAEA